MIVGSMNFLGSLESPYLTGFGAFLVIAWNLVAALVSIPMILREFIRYVDRQASVSPVSPVTPPNIRPTATTEYARALTKYPSLHKDLVRIFESKYQEGVEPSHFAIDTNRLLGLLPEILEPNAGGKPLKFFFPLEEDKRYQAESLLYRLGDMAEEVGNLKMQVVIPTKLRTGHHSVIAGSMHGKTTLFKSMIVDDLKEDACIIIIDSQSSVIKQIAERVDPDRLVLIDPRTCPPALNLFADRPTDEAAQGNALQMFDYIFASKGVEFTTNQARLYRNLSRLCMAVPGASLVTMREMCKPMATVQYQSYIDTLDDNTRSFFAEYHQKNNGMYGGTREEVLGRLQTALDSPTFAKMLGSRTMPLNMLNEIEAGKVILISTDKDFLQDSGASLLGRIFAGLVMQAVRSRPELTGKRVYLYIDEFADYASDAPLMIELFKQGRKRNLGMIVAFQVLSDLTPKLASDMSTSTAIRMAGGIGGQDENIVTTQLRTDKETLRMQPQGTFLAFFKDVGTIPYPVQANRLEAMPKHGRMQEVIERMRREYGEEPAPPPKPAAEDDFKEAF